MMENLEDATHGGFIRLAMIARHNQMTLRPNPKPTLFYLHQKSKNDYRKGT
jgi:hypothetical protein